MAAQIFVKVDKEFYFAGDTVQGQVFLNLYENMNANEVLIKFKGWQTVRWIEKRHLSEEEANRVGGGLIWHNNIRVKMDSSDSSSDEGEQQSMKYNYVKSAGQVYQVHRYSGGRIVAKFSSVLHNFQGSFIPSGQYVFPFSFKTGEDYPASFCDRDPDQQRKGRTKYEMRVFVRGFNGRRRLIKHRTEIIVRETTVIKNDKQEMEAHVKSCCCMDQGVSKIQCYFDKNAYCPGEQAKIYCILDTRGSLVDVTKVTVALVNKIIYTSKQNHQKTIENWLFKQQFPGLPKNQEIQRDKMVSILNEKNPDKHAIMPTSRGSRLQSIYFLRVEAELDASCTCCSDLPIVNQPIVIYPYIPVNYFFQAPPNWQPEEFPMINLENAISASNNNLNEMNNPYY